MIEVNAVTKSFGSIAALQGVSLKAAKGDVVGFLGPNGAGKTTLMRILACFFPPTTGTARVAGFDVTRNSLEVRRKIGYFLESVALYPDMKVLAFLDFVAEAKGVPKHKRKRNVSEILDKCGLGRVSHRIIGNLSKGYHQRVGLAQALINEPEVLFLDEPTIGLDPEHVIEIRKLIKNLGGERTVVLSTHILSEASIVCNKIIIMNKGKIVAVDTTEKLGNRFKQNVQFLVQIEGSSEMVKKGLNEIAGVLDIQEKEKISEGVVDYLIKVNKNTDFHRELCSLAFKNRWILRKLQPLEMNLEDIFLKLIGKEA